MDVTETCLLCGLDVDSDGSVMVSKGLDNLRRHSDKRGDGLRVIMDMHTQIRVHIACRLRYIQNRPFHSTRAVPSSDSGAGPSTLQQEPHRLRSSSSVTFEYKLHCIFCGEIASPKAEQVKRKHLRRAIHVVQTVPIQESVISAAKARTDEWGQIVLARVNTQFNLISLEARYHATCYLKFTMPVSQEKRSRGRPEDPVHRSALIQLFKFMEENDECQYAVAELQQKFITFLPPDYEAFSSKTLKTKLIDHFGSAITITSVPGGKSILTFTANSCSIFNAAWYSERARNCNDEKFEILEAAIEIIRDDISKVVYEHDSYSGIDEMFNGAQELVPDSLRFLIEGIVMKRKVNKRENWLRKCIAIEHAIISATRPNSFLSMIQVGLAVYLHRRYGSRSVIDMLYSLGVCSSYSEVALYESSIIVGGQITISNTAFTQYVFDNADFNSRTLDGLGTFHSMGGIQCITPSSEVTSSGRLKRLKKDISAKVTGAWGKIEILQYPKRHCSGLDGISVEDIHEIHLFPPIVISALQMDCLWLCGNALDEKQHCAWSGFMERATAGSKSYEISRVVPLPFVNLDPNDVRSIYTAMMVAVNDCNVRGQSSCFVTFDQPLYWKAVDMVAASGPTGDLSPVIVRLGGFHMLMSFLGSIGNIMAGSGLEELWHTVYARNSVTHMITGHAYARALRAHFLTQMALGIIAFRNLPEKDPACLDAVLACYSDVFDSDELHDSAGELTIINDVMCQLNTAMQSAADVSRTAKLWKQYYEQVQIIRLFIRAERTGDWQLHLYSVKCMIPHFHAAGHFPYAKSSQVYLQQMCNLETKMNSAEFLRFTRDGFFTVRRTDKLWAGSWTDLTIEQFLMRSMKTSGGLTRGRGLTDSVLSRWVLTMPICAALSEKFEEFCGIRTTTSEQHVDLRESRRSRDFRDMSKFIEWLDSRHPFDPERLQLVSLSSGVVGDDTINCDSVIDCAKITMARIVGSTFANIKLKKSETVRSLATVTKGVKVRDDVIAVDTMTLFNRIICVIDTEYERRKCFEYELAPQPLSLFTETLMRKSNKSELSTVFEKRVKCIESLPVEVLTYVVDGGHLLHRVVWQSSATFCSIYRQYVSYVHRHYGVTATIVFDGYGDAIPNTKDHEHNRRATKGRYATFVVGDDVTVTCTQADFLSNGHNKSQFIAALTSYILNESSLTVIQAPADADVLIVKTAVSVAREKGTAKVAIIGEDTDLLVLLIYLADLNIEIFLVKPGKRCGKDKIYSSSDLQANLGPLCRHILFLHAVTGCDTTSAPYGQGKAKAVKLLEKNIHLRDVIDVFNDPNALRQNIANAGEQFLISLYDISGSDATKLSTLRYYVYSRTVAKQKVSSNFKLQKLPPTTAAAAQHSYRVFHQVQQWRGVDMDATHWGWKRVGSTLMPVTTFEQPAPESLINLINCNCKAGCRGACQCRKSSLKCSTMCGHCRGTSCSNAADIETLTDDDVTDNNIIDDGILEDVESIWNIEGISFSGTEEVVSA